jgi:hypothetical protein
VNKDTTLSLLGPTEHFNALSEEQKKEVLSGGLGAAVLQSGLSFAVPLWWVFKTTEDDLGLRNGSACLVDFGDGIFAVTAAHVFREYVQTKEHMKGIMCQLGDALFEPDRQLIDCRDDLDIATFRVSPADISQINKPTVKPDPPGWLPLVPAVKRFRILRGVPGADTRDVTYQTYFRYSPLFRHASNNKRY